MKRNFVVRPKSITASSDLSLVNEFLKYHEDPDTYRNNPEGFEKMYDILDCYGDESEDVDVVFNRASVADQRKMIDLMKNPITAAISTSDDSIDSYITNLSEAISDVTEDNYRTDELCNDLYDTVDELIRKLEPIIADRIYPFDQYGVRAVDDTQFYDNFNDNGDLSDAWDKYDEFCAAAKAYSYNTDKLEKLLECLKGM